MRSWRNKIPVVFWITLLAIVLSESVLTFLTYHDEAPVRTTKSELMRLDDGDLTPDVSVTSPVMLRTK